MIKNLSIRHICGYALGVRILALVLITILSSYVSTGFYGSTYEQDDVRMLAGAEIYSRTAKSIIDRPALENAFDVVEPGRIHDEVASMEFDNWFISISMYLLGNEILVRLLYILCSVFSVKCIYDIGILLYNKQVATLSSILYALMPYPVIFSCFLYKDHLYTLVVLLLIRKALKCAGNIHLKDVIFLSFFLFISLWIRSGLVVLVLFALLIIIYKRGNYTLKLWKIVLFTVVLLSLVSVVTYYSWDIIVKKITIYIIEYNSAESSIIDYFTIKSPSQIYRYPFSLFFLMLQPLGYLIKAGSWYELACVINVIGIPLAVGNIYYLFNFKMKKGYFYWLMQLFFLLTVITSLSIPRHYFYLQPFIMLFFSVYYLQLRKKFLFNITSLAGILIMLSLFVLM